MIVLTLWIQKAKAVVDAFWGVTCLFCVPAITVTGISLLLPQGAHGSGVAGSRYTINVPRIVEEAPRSYTPPAGSGNMFAYRLGLFDSRGRLVHEYPDQMIESNSNARHGSIVVDIPADVPSGDYTLRVFKSAGEQVRDVPMNVGD